MLWALEPLVKADTFVPEIGDVADRRIALNQNALAVGDRLACGIDDRSARGLGEDRRAVADRAIIDAADIHRLHHRRARGKLDPLHGDALRGKMLLQRGPPPRDHQHAVLLIADADFPDVGLRPRRPRYRSARRGCRRQLQEFTTLHTQSPDQNARAPARSFEANMMVSLEIGVESPAKIAMRSLLSRVATMGLLP